MSNGNLYLDNIKQTSIYSGIKSSLITITKLYNPIIMSNRFFIKLKKAYTFLYKYDNYNTHTERYIE